MDSLGCRVQKAFYVNIDKRTNFYIPNIFTPNGDGVNDEFVFHSSVPIRSIENFRLYDRWGALIIEKYGLTGNEIILWDGIHDGIIAHPGVYVYYIKLITADGRVYQLGGDITLMR
jgi:gliding motility-associated-like protein